jgi:TldD protein
VQAVDDAFLALPRDRLADAALDRAKALGAAHADIRVERVRQLHVSVRDRRLEGANEDEDIGLGVRVVHNGAWGFSSTMVLTPEAAALAVEEAVGLARTTAPLSREPIELAPEPPHAGATWESPFSVNPFSVPVGDRADLLIGWTDKLLEGKGVDHADASVVGVIENKFYADLAGTVTLQQRVRVHPVATAVSVDATTGAFETMRTLAPPVGRGWEYLTGDGWDWDDELAKIPELLAEKLRAPSVEPGTYDLVIDPTNLWLTIHESVGHATELDRALGYEAAYAGTSFATFDRLGKLRYGSPAMNVTGDRTAPHGLATIGYDDEGVEAQSWDLVKEGVLVGYQLDRRIAALAGFPRSNGCAFADSPSHMPLQRMANVSLQPARGGPTTAQLLEQLGEGIYIVGDKSWSIDMQRYNFQFTGQRFYAVRGGRLAGQLRDVAYQATTTDFWGSLEAVGGEGTYLLCGAPNCGKGQPGQVAPVSHGCPSALFRGVGVLNSAKESGR